MLAITLFVNSVERFFGSGGEIGDKGRRSLLGVGVESSFWNRPMDFLHMWPLIVPVLQVKYHVLHSTCTKVVYLCIYLHVLVHTPPPYVYI